MTIISYDQLTPEVARKGCFVTDMPNDAYHSYEGVSKSGLDLINTSPAHYAHAERKEPTRFMVIGTAIHTALLEPERFADEYLLLRGITDRRKSEYKEAIKTRPEELVLTGKEADLVAGMQEAVYANPYAREHLEDDSYLREVSAFVECPETGVLLRARYDLLDIDGARAADVKKTQDISYQAFQRSVGRYRYHVQDAFYSRVFELITGRPLEAFRFICVEESSPHASKLYQLDDEAKQVGLSVTKRNIATFAECSKSNVWPYPDGSEELMSLPLWAIDEQDEEVSEVSL